MKRHSRAQLLVSMGRKQNIQEETIESTKSHRNPSNNSSKGLECQTEMPFNNAYFAMQQPSIFPDSVTNNETCVSEQRTTIDDTFTPETFSTYGEMILNEKIVTEPSTSFHKTTIDETVVAAQLSTLDDLNTSETVLIDLDHLQESAVPNIEYFKHGEETSIVHNSTISGLDVPNMINNTQVIPTTIDFPHSATITSLDHSHNGSLNIEAMQISDTSSHGLLNPETGLFEEDLHERETNDIQSNVITSIKNKRKYNQVLRLHGKEYDGLVKAGETMINAKKPQKQLKPVPCNHGAIGLSDRSFLCSSVNDRGRKDIFHYFWSLSSWEAKKAYILGLVSVRSLVKRRKTTKTDTPTLKSVGVDCYLPKEDGIKVKVCREMFLATLDIKKDVFTEWTKSKSCNTSCNIDTSTERAMANGSQVTTPNVKPLTSDSVVEWLDQLAKVPSHYCRSSSSRTYVDDALHSKTQMHKEYVSWCESNNKRFVQRKKFCEILESKKISIYKPRKDQCDTCVSYKEGNLEEEAYQNHLLKKNDAREAKKRAIASMSDEHLVFTMDLQSVQLCPKLLVSSQYYKQKLQLHVFTIYINNTKDVHIFAWHEGDGSVTANEFVTCIVTLIELYALKGFKKMSIISDGCGYQNRNKVLSSALADVSRLKSVEIEQIILEKGHTMMEVDSVHSTLEKCFTPPLYSPADYVTRMQKARPSQPYIIRHVDFKFFKNFEAVPSNFASIRPGKKAGDPTVADIRSLLYKNGETFYKINHNETEWTMLPQRRKADLYEEARGLYTEPRKIEKSKFDSLQSLKPFMHRDYHSFYDSLFS